MVIRVEDIRSISVFDGLTDSQLAELIAVGSELRVEPGVEVFREGDPADFWFLLVDGGIELIRHSGREDMVVGHMDVPGRWSGGFRAWDEHGVYLATGRGRTAGRVLRVPSSALRERSDAWFPFGGHLIAGLYGTARRIESTARQRDSLVTLGTLAAGLAHEINNPAAAATRAVDALGDSLELQLSSLAQLAVQGISAEQFGALDTLRNELAAPVASPDPLARADQEEVLSDWLDRHRVGRGWLIAPQFAAAGVDIDWCERAAKIFGSTALEPGLEWVTSTLATHSLLAELKESTRRIAELVAAVRSYSQLDRAAMQRTTVTDGLESTLVMLGHKLRDGVEIVRDYDAAATEIDAYAGELNQVWTNLIDNAVDAMDGAGTLTLTTRATATAVVVSIGDTGTGMPPQVAARAFEAFYTTKDVGKGTGLGLDIAQRIVVERHGGSIDIESRPGRTVMTVRLPLRQPDARG